MADSKISALPASTTPLAGTEVLPIVQSSTTKQVSVANLTAGRAVSALTLASTTGATFATTSGSVGIGTASPAVLLEVAGSGRFSRSGAATQYFQFNMDSASNKIVSEGTSKVLQIVNNNATSGGISFDNTVASSYIFSQAGTEKMRFDASANLGIGTTANASAILDVQSTTKGVRMPNMTTTQKNAIASPAAGLMVFDTTLAKLCVYSGAAWQTITSV